MISEAKKPWLRLTPTMKRVAKDNKAQIIVEIPVVQFLEITTTPEMFREILDQAHTLQKYNRWAKIGDDDDFYQHVNKGRNADNKEYGSIIMPFLKIYLDKNGIGQIKGHEGRHRAAALLKSGQEYMPVALMITPYDGMFPNVYNDIYMITSEHMPNYVVGQYDKNIYATDKWKVIDGDMQSVVRNRML